ncbi:thermonuclease family protein [Acuticoccus sp. M5D2P5]|uniref:thermonuclease family protein n=1 Tax=Acuticoccus kalidii TaxID=2910977 RepID=UPI001F29752B|nr:thermonuclease family protein [Acuticoccus kalidii]MCF3933370.1 thermonuclease family protein [Acuticoccus kalidii]
MIIAASTPSRPADPLRRARPRLARIVATLVALLAANVANAACFGPEEPVEIAGIEGGSSLALTDGRTVRLADIRLDIAQIPTERAALLRARAEVEPVAFRPLEGGDRDRYGRHLGDIVFKDTAESLRERMVSDGLAFVDPTDMSEGCLTALFEAERGAENDGVGLWAQPEAVFDAAQPDLSRYAGQYALVDGVVKSVGETKRNLYLNFGENFRTDFTVIVRRQDAERWEGGFTARAGVGVRIRGVLEAWNGGLIRVEHPAQIEWRDSSGL